MTEHTNRKDDRFVGMRMRMRVLCAADRGLMKVTAHPAGGYKPMLPLDPNAKDCRGDNRTIFCFKAGKPRPIDPFSFHLHIHRFLRVRN